MRSFRTDYKSFEVELKDEIITVLENEFNDFFEWENLSSDDVNCATDFKSFIAGTTIGARFRSYKYYSRYPTDFTIRYDRPSGRKSEYQKIMSGCMGYLLYGFVKNNKIIRYNIFDMEVFKSIKHMPKDIISNYDGSSKFFVFSIKQFPQNLTYSR